MEGTVAYMGFADFRVATLMPRSFVDELEAAEPGFIDQRIFYTSSKIDRSLAKRYDVPFKPPYPTVVLEWCVAIVTLECWLKRGIAATDQQAETYQRMYDTALAELAQAADSEKGLFELPIRGDKDGAGVTRGFPRAYSETSPYVWATKQARRGHREDEQS